jgi:hypothetical protein
MFWWYERCGKFVRIEALELRTGGYELHIRAPDGTEQIERVATYDALQVRYEFVRAQLLDAKWNGPTRGPA